MKDTNKGYREDEKMSKLYDNLNEQMNFELESAYIYATMSAYLDSLNMKGMTHFFDEQVKKKWSMREKSKNFCRTQDTA